jgi:hypothetical protein
MRMRQRDGGWSKITGGPLTHTVDQSQIGLMTNRAGLTNARWPCTESGHHSTLPRRLQTGACGVTEGKEKGCWWFGCEAKQVDQSGRAETDVVA